MTSKGCQANRGTIRYPGWCETWLQIVRLRLPNETLRIPNLHKLTYRDFVELFILSNASGTAFEQRVANFLQINPTGKIMENLKWLGLFSNEIIGDVVGVSAKLILEGKIKIAGCQIPTHPEVYKPVLRELSKEGLKLKKKVSKIQTLLSFESLVKLV